MKSLYLVRVMKIADIIQRTVSIMNIFDDDQGFLGENDFVTQHNVFHDFLDQARSIRKKLGAQAYKLDEYIRLLLMACNFPIEANFETDPNNITAPLSDALASLTTTGDPAKSKTYLTAVKVHLEKFPLKFQEAATKRRIYYCQLVDKFLEFGIDQVVNDIWSDITSYFDPPHVTGLFKEICELLGDESEMERLNDLFARRFLATPLRHIAYQFVANHLTAVLLERDPETSCEIFRLLLESD